jgi:hypothetical protein
MVKVVQGDLPATLGSIRDIDTESGTWRTITDSATYAGNLIAGTLPMLALLTASTVGSAVALPGGVAALAMSTMPAAVLYSGQFFADQADDKKNPGLALSAGISAATLDRLGLAGMLKGGNIFNRVGRDEVVKTMIANSGGKMAVAEAEKILAQASKKTILETAGAGAEFASKHYASKQAAYAAVRELGVDVALESATESGQTLLEMIATSGEIDPNIRYEKQFHQSLIDAAIGGGLMAGGISVGKTAIEMAQWGSAAHALKAYEGQMNDAQAFQAQQKELHELGGTAGTPFGVLSTQDALQKVRDIASTGIEPGLHEMTGLPGNWNGFMSIVKDPVRMLRGLGATTVRNMRKANGELKFYSNILKAIMQPGILPGDSFDGFRQRIISEWQTTDAATLATKIGRPEAAVNTMLRESWQTAWSKGGVVGGSPEMDQIQSWKDEVDKVAAQATTVMSELGYDTSKLAKLDSVFIDAAINPQLIARNEGRIVSTMTANGASGRVARQAVSDMTSGNRDSIQNAKNLMEQHGVFSDPALNDLFEPNVFGAFEQFKHRVATDASQKIYLGDNGDFLAKLIHRAHAAGEFSSEHEYNDTVQNAQDFYKIATGTYNTLEKYPAIEKILGWGTTLMMLASLGKATFSSLPESAMATMGTSGHKVGAQLKENVRAFFEEYRSDINKGISHSVSLAGLSWARSTPNGRAQVELQKLKDEADELDARNPASVSPAEMEVFSKKVKKFHKKYLGRSLFERLGFNDSGYNVQAKFETDTANMKKTMQVFASLIGLNAITNSTRIAVLSMGADILNTRLHDLLSIPAEGRREALRHGTGLTNGQFQGLREMQSWGMDVEKVLGLLTQTQLTSQEDLDMVLNDIAVKDNTRMPTGSPVQQLRDELSMSLRNMVNQRATNPQIANLPKYYHDPRLRIFTAMTRFVASMTANLLPRLYVDYIKNGSTGMRYQAFVTMAMGITFAYMANMLKDILSYGDDENPYLKGNVKAAQRALYGSGLLGRGEAVVDTFVPLYDTRKADPTEDPITYAYQSFRNSAPLVSWGDRVVGAMYDLSTGKTEQGVKKAVKSMPLVGSFPIAAKTAADLTKE